MKTDAVILGGGLAGAAMAARLCEAGADVLLFDAQHPDSASQVAAGLYNVVTGRFGAKTWMADLLLAELGQWLDRPMMEPLRGMRHPMEIYRPFPDPGTYNKWRSRAGQADFESIVAFQETPRLPELIENPHGGISILPCGWMEAGPFTEGLLRLLEQSGRLRRVRASLPYESILLREQTLRFEGENISFGHLICCEGHRLLHNPWWSHLPIIPNKGEILILEAGGWELSFILSRHVYLIPLGGSRYLTGSTYQNRFSDPFPSEAGKAEILGQLGEAFRGEYRVLEHRAGIRPTTPDRRPIAGTHPAYPWLHVLGGFGTKGVLSAPWLSRLLAAKLLHGEDGLPPEVSPERF
ncbi:MAG: FAD-binding oxidoreductase [Bacteroidia bacterium]|nr:FAD-binding oxidoreductase [Bacteroidia bacterium]